MSDLTVLHDRWHALHPVGSVASPADVQAHHTVTAKMAAAGLDHGCEMPVAVEMYRSRVDVAEALQRTGVPMGVLAALRQANEQGIALADVIGMLTVNGYELRVAPVDSEAGDDEDVVAALVASTVHSGDVEDLEDDEDHMGKAVSFAAENRLIARNKKRKVAKEPHPFRAARWVTRDGRTRCVLCGRVQAAEGEPCAGLGYEKAVGEAVVTDLDDTLVSGDSVIERTAEHLRKMHEDGYSVIVVSGRPVSRMAETREWLNDHDIPHASVHLSDFPEGPNASREFKVYKAKRLIEDGWRIVEWIENDAATRAALKDEGVNVVAPGSLSKATGVSEGDFVSWQSSGGTARGRVEHVMEDGVLGVPDSDFSVRAEPGDPALLIRIWRRGPEGWTETETLVGHKSSTVRRIDALNKAEDTFTPPEGVQQAAQRALDWIAEGHAGANFTDVGRARAAQLARGGTVSLATIKRMWSFFRRHEQSSKGAEGFNAGEDGFPSAGRVAWDAWGGDPGYSWVKGIYERLDLGKSDPGTTAVHVDTIMPGRRSRRKPPGFISTDPQVLADANGDGEDYLEPEDVLTPRQRLMYDMYETVADLFGPWDLTDGADGAHYIPADSNVFADQGLACSNCVFYEGGGLCEIVSEPVEDAGVCKLWIIAEDLLPDGSDMEAPEVEAAIGPHSFKKGEDGDGCSVCGQAEDNWRHSVSKALMQKEDSRRFTLGPMYIPDMEDAHGEWTDADELQQGVWGYVRTGDRRIRLQHNREVVAGEWVEVMAWPYPVTVPMTDPSDGRSVKVTYPANTVFLGVVWEPWAWELVKAGKLRGYSIGGTADRVLADLPEEGNRS